MFDIEKIDDSVYPFTEDQILVMINVIKSPLVIASAPKFNTKIFSSTYWQEALINSVKNMNIQFSLIDFIQDPSDCLSYYEYDLEKLKPTQYYWTVFYSGNEDYGSIIPDYILLVRCKRLPEEDSYAFYLHQFWMALTHKIPEILFVTMLHEPKIVQRRLNLLYKLLFSKNSDSIREIRKELANKFPSIKNILTSHFLEYFHEFDYKGKGGDNEYQEFRQRHMR